MSHILLCFPFDESGKLVTAMTTLYPLRFEPLFRQYLWGGRRLGTELNKPIDDDGVFAESWEIVDHGDDQSIVANGPLAGTSLHELIEQDATALLGDRVATAIRSESLPSNLRNRFPLLLKMLDASRDLSVQVHPNDAQGSRLDPPDLGKTEAWMVIDAVPGSKIYAGLKAGIDREAFAAAVAAGRTEETLHSFEPSVGDCIFIPAGTIHAIGAGLLVAEIQQASDTTFRIYDWGRVEANGQPRTLHIKQSLDVIDFESGPVSPVTPVPVASDAAAVTLVDCDKFTLQRYTLSDSHRIDTRNTFQVIAVLSGAIRIAGDASADVLRKGDTMLVPACVESILIDPVEAAELMVASA
ncbi:type I phosphomannose isomerase catalytic subunit [Allorhodopirellula heiligendammensis]|uniref:Mannose-6-phosphate isomerase GmuF n=1 Tax=Allorhodopirellula heiligendammensis TaxID=2714739 RepID=A0A5C6C4X9_9BACT|nr:type I phosphomannose isomerase catalytic subunit [Allorhodopirellula heiligendammensis]TWU19152.1 putative mannose-6-phosphate isomerase GmuF [Allorhodopirellula heiligendammensis]